MLHKKLLSTPDATGAAIPVGVRDKLFQSIDNPFQKASSLESCFKHLDRSTREKWKKKQRKKAPTQKIKIDHLTQDRAPNASTTGLLV